MKQMKQTKDLDKICCVCGHELGMHIDEGDGWRCHSIAADGYQCECWLRKGRYDGIEGYSLGVRTREHIEELKRFASTGDGS